VLVAVKDSINSSTENEFNRVISVPVIDILGDTEIMELKINIAYEENKVGEQYLALMQKIVPELEQELVAIDFSFDMSETQASENQCFIEDKKMSHYLMEHMETALDFSSEDGLKRSYAIHLGGKSFDSNLEELVRLAVHKAAADKQAKSACKCCGQCGSH
jgi:hypothetical protein